ncbi:hypothetical protein ALT785_110212 [Alteromonas infernus]
MVTGVILSYTLYRLSHILEKENDTFYLGTAGAVCSFYTGSCNLPLYQPEN